MQLGHDGNDCPHPHPPATLTVVDLLSIHRVRVAFCDCGGTHYYVQMLRAGWWPASLKRPRSGFTMRTLKFFQALSLLSKTNGYDFWRTIVYMTDGSGVENLPVSPYHPNSSLTVARSGVPISLHILILNASSNVTRSSC